MKAFNIHLDLTPTTPPSYHCLVWSDLWQIESAIQGSGTGPVGCFNVPTSVWAKVQTGDKDVRVSACTKNNSSSSCLAGLPRTLTTPGRLWSHIALDFITGLSLSGGKTVILTIIDRFSKTAHFVARPKLPSVL